MATSGRCLPKHFQTVFFATHLPPPFPPLLYSPLSSAKLSRANIYLTTSLPTPCLRRSLLLSARLTGRRIGGAYLERQKLAGEHLLHMAIPGRA
ncbi:hypothetical protein ILYODFUR_014611 [Ilyodon furcidens]|uniref:Uncharacterized protein n=1 Tax=Ilyodon furcidens TaxID=33524 RepID=A0ABV0SL65_9TELE